MLHSQARFSRSRILVVDDSFFARRLIASLLEKCGFSRFEMAEDGIDGLDKARVMRPDIILLDINMPRLDGFGFCEQARREPALSRIPIIVQTERDDRASRLRALSCGADDFLTKPLDMEEMKLRLHLHLDRYFMFTDMADMCACLKMELESAEGARREVSQHIVPDSLTDFLDNHTEVLQQLAEQRMAGG